MSVSIWVFLAEAFELSTTILGSLSYNLSSNFKMEGGGISPYIEHRNLGRKQEGEKTGLKSGAGA